MDNCIYLSDEVFVLDVGEINGIEDGLRELDCDCDGRHIAIYCEELLEDLGEEIELSNVYLEEVRMNTGSPCLEPGDTIRNIMLYYQRIVAVKGVRYAVYEVEEVDKWIM